MQGVIANTFVFFGELKEVKNPNGV